MLSGKFNFFESVSDEITVSIFNETSYKVQGKLAQVSKEFHRIASDKTLELFKYKPGNMHIEIGDVRVAIEKGASSWCPYLMSLKKNDLLLFDAYLGMSKRELIKLIDAIKDGTLSFIDTLASMGLSASERANFLREEFEKQAHATCKM